MTSQTGFECSVTDRRTMICSDSFKTRAAIVNLLMVSGLLASATAAQAQFVQPVYARPAYAVPVCEAGYPQVVRTFYANGVSEVIRSEGEYNLKTAQALLVMQDVQAKQLINRTNAIRNYYQMKDEWHDRQEAKRNSQIHRPAPEPVPETVVRTPRSHPSFRRPRAARP